MRTPNKRPPHIEVALPPRPEPPRDAGDYRVRVALGPTPDPADGYVVRGGERP